MSYTLVYVRLRFSSTPAYTAQYFVRLWLPLSSGTPTMLEDRGQLI